MGIADSRIFRLFTKTPPTRPCDVQMIGARPAFANTASPPPEVVSILEQRGLSPEQIDALGWYAHPKLGAPRQGLGRKALSNVGLVDAQELMEPLLERGNRKILGGALYKVDPLNGCLTQCDTCYVDAPLPTKMFSAGSWGRLIKDRRFLSLLRRRSWMPLGHLRFGSVGNFLDHPQCIEIAEMTLRSRRIHPLTIFVNYRPRTEQQLDALIKLAKSYRQRLRVIISLPLNRTDRVSWAFQEYVNRRPQWFDIENLLTWDDGLYNFFYDAEDNRVGGTKLRNVDIQDVRHAHGRYALGMFGRVLSDSAIAGRIRDYDMYRPWEEKYGIDDRGFVGIVLNPDALWLKAHASIAESHTTFAYTPLTAQSLSVLKYLQYHHGFKRLRHWPGGVGTKRSVYDRLPLEGPSRPVVVVE